MGCVHEEQIDLVLLDLYNQWLQGLCFEGFLGFDIDFGRYLPHLAADNLVLLEKLTHLGQGSGQPRHFLDDDPCFLQGSRWIVLMSSNDLIKRESFVVGKAQFSDFGNDSLLRCT